MADYWKDEGLLQLGEIDPELKEILDSQPQPPIDYSNLHDFSQMYNEHAEMAKKTIAPPPPEIRVTDLYYVTRDGSKNRAKLFQPVNAQNRSPLIVMIHGGGFCLGSPEGEEQSCRNFSLSLGATCVSISYRLAPKHPFPYAPNDCWDALKWCAANAESWGADTSAGFCVGGTSAGGNLAAVLTHRARDEKIWPPITGQYLAIPLLCPVGKMPEKYTQVWRSYEQNENAPFLPKAAIDMFMDSYKPNNDDGVNFAVFNHPNGHGNLPRTFLQVDGMDPLRDDAIVYERVLREENGIETRMDVYPGVPHGHWAFFPSLKASKMFRVDQLEGMGWLLDRKPDFSLAAINTAAATV